MTKKKAKRLITDISFEGDNAHMALVSVDQGGGANGVDTLLMKAAEDTSKMNSKQIESLKEIIKSVQGVSDLEASQMIGNVTDEEAGGVSPVSEVNKASNEAVETPKEDNKMSDTDVQALIQKALADKEAELKKAAKEEFEAIEKGLKEELETFKAKEAELKKAQFEEEALLYKSLGVTEDTKGDVAVALMKAKGDEVFKPILTMLEKAQNIVKQVEEGTFKPEGHSVESTAEEMSGVMKALNAMKETENK